MQFVPPTHEQTPIRCSGCHTRYVSFLAVRDVSTQVEGYEPQRCTCGHLEDRVALPPGRLFGVDGDPVKQYHPLTRPN